MALAFVMVAKHWHLRRSLDYFRSIRPYVSPNPGFQSQLRLYQRQIVLPPQFPEETDQYYHCPSCSEILFEVDDILHGIGPKCTEGVDVMEQSWMNYWELAEGPGEIRCYQCNEAVGTFSLSGRLCSCGEETQPSFCMLR